MCFTHKVNKKHIIFIKYLFKFILFNRDYLTDTKIVVESSIRILQALVDLATEKGYLETLINLVFLIQQIYQGIWMADSAFKNIPYFSIEMIDYLNKEYKIRNLK